MKKYIKPAVVTVKIDNQTILAGSDKQGMLDGETETQGAKNGMWSDED